MSLAGTLSFQEMLAGSLETGPISNLSKALSLKQATRPIGLPLLKMFILLTSVTYKNQ